MFNCYNGCECGHCVDSEVFVVTSVRQTPGQWRYVALRGQRFGSAHIVAVEPTHDIADTVESLGFPLDGHIPEATT